MADVKRQEFNPDRVLMHEMRDGRYQTILTNLSY